MQQNPKREIAASFLMLLFEICNTRLKDLQILLSVNVNSNAIVTAEVVGSNPIRVVLFVNNL